MAVPTQYPRIKPIQPSSRMIFFVNAIAEVPSRPVCNRDLRTSSGVQIAPEATARHTSECVMSTAMQAGQRSYIRSTQIVILAGRPGLTLSGRSGGDKNRQLLQDADFSILRKEVFAKVSLRGYLRWCARLACEAHQD